MHRLPWTCCPLYLLAGIVFSGLTLPSPGHSQEPAPEVLSKFSQRYDGFKLLFGDQGFGLGTIEELETSEDLSDWIVVELGSDPQSYEWLARPIPFLMRGARILIASDQAILPNAAGLPARFHSGQVRSPPGPLAYNGRSECPILVNFDTTTPLFRNVSSLALNRPGWLVPQTDSALVVARFSRGTSIDGIDRTDPPAAMVVTSSAKGRMLLVADQSLFVNEMLLELDNVVFARNVVEWLAAGKSPKEMKVLFFEGDAAATTWVDEAFRTGDWTEPPPLDALLAVANELLSGMQQENVFNKMLQTEQNQLSDRTVRQWRLLIPAVLLTLFLGWRLHRGHARQRKKLRPIPLDEDQTLEQRRRLTLAKGNFADAGASLASEFFHQFLPGPAWREQPPRIHRTGGWWTRWRTQREIASAWRLAMGSQRRLSRRGFERLKNRVSHWTRGLEAGSMTLKDSARDGILSATKERG